METGSSATPPHRVVVSPSSGSECSSQAASVHSTPRARRLDGSSQIASKQKNKAAFADPNNAKCLLTLQSTAVMAYHLLSKRARGLNLEVLEWWWGLRHNTLNLDTRYNIVFLRVDLYDLLNGNHCALLPDVATIDMVYEMQRQIKTRQKPLAYPRTEFTYRLVPLWPTTQEVTITRITCSATDPSSSQFSIHRYPFTDLGPLRSHAHPHFAIYNAGTKTLPPRFFTTDMLEIFRQCMQIATMEEAMSCIDKINYLHSSWTSYASYYSACDRSPNGHCFSEKHTRSSFSRSAAASSCTSIRSGQFNPPLHIRKWQYANTSDCREPVESDNEDDLLENITESKKRVSEWWDQTSEIVTRDGGWDPVICNDDQLGPYVEEHSRSPNQKWDPTWMRRGLEDIHKPPPDTSKFSSNDWCLKDFCIRLPDPVCDDFRDDSCDDSCDDF